jgi:signal transduction histidine kinase
VRFNEALKHTLDLLAAEKDIDKVLGHLLAVATEVLGGSGSLLWLRDFESNTTKLHLFYWNGTLLSGPTSGHRLAGQIISLDRHDLFVLEAFRFTRPVWHEVQTSHTLSDAAKEYLRNQGVHALLGIPLILGDQTIGVIMVRLAQMREFGSVELEFAQSLAQQATLALQLTRLAELARNAAITEERNRMAREIHDTLAQSFTGILIHLQAAQQISDGSHRDLKTHLDSAISLARHGLAEARRSVLALRPQLLHGADIASALNRLVESLSGESLLRISLSISGERPALATEVESTLLRVTQEAITNAMRHSGGSEIRVELHMAPEDVKLTIADDGAGFDPKLSVVGRGLGLISMQERADRVGGELTIFTEPGAGTKIHLWVPLAQARA